MPTTAPEGSATRTPSLVPWASALGVLFFLTVWPYILTENGTNALDQNRFHYPSIVRFHGHWPRVDLVKDFDASTGPLYHFVMAALPTAVVRSKMAVALVSSLFSLALLIQTFRYLARLAGSSAGFLLVLPMACNQWFQASGIWISTDNFALLFVFHVIFDPALVAAPGLPRAAGYALAATVATMARHVHAWTAGSAALSSLLRTPLRRLVPTVLVEPEEEAQPLSWAYLVTASVSMMAPFAVVGFLYVTWGGLVLPQFRADHSGFDPALIVYALAVFGLQAPGYLPVLGRHLGPALRRPSVYLPGVVTALLRSAVRTELLPTNSIGSLRWGSRFLPTVQGRSVLILILAVVGAVSLAVFWRRARERRDTRYFTFLAVSLFGWALAQAFNPLFWQRYYEVVAIASFAVLTARYGRDPGEPWPRPGLACVALLALAHLVLTNLRFLEIL